MGTYTPTKQLASTAAVRAKEWTLDDPLVRLEISGSIPDPITYTEDNTTYTVTAGNSSTTTSVGNGWIESGKSYLLLVTLRYQINDVNDEIKIRMLERSTGSNVEMSGSMLRHQRRASAPDANHYMTYNYVTKFTASSTSTNGPIAHLERLGGTADVTQGYAQMILFDLTNLKEGNDYFFEEDATDSANTTSAVTKESCTLNLTADNKGAWLLGSSLQYKAGHSSCGNYQFSTIISDQDANVFNSEPVLHDPRFENEENVLNFMTVVNNDLSDSSWTINVYASDESNAIGRGSSQNTTQHSKAWGIRLDRFVSTTFSSDISANTSTANDTKTTAIELISVPVKYSSPKFLVIQGGVANLPDTGTWRDSQRLLTDVQWKINGGTYARFGDADQYNISTMRWKGSDTLSADFDNNVGYYSFVPPPSLSSVSAGDTLSFKLELAKTDVGEDEEEAVECTDLFLAVIELPTNTNREADQLDQYSLKANHEELIVGPTTLQRCIDTRNKMLNVRGFRFPERWDTLWTIDTSEKL